MRLLRVLTVAVCAVLLTLTACSAGSGAAQSAVTVISDPPAAAESLQRGDCRTAENPVPAGPSAPASVSSSADASPSAPAASISSSAPAGSATAGSAPATSEGTTAGTVLTVNGASDSGTAAKVSLTLAQLDALPQVECTVDDRIAEGRQVRFQGVLLSTLLSHLGADRATTLSASALNDYSVDLPMSDITDLPVLLATRLDGTPMSVAHYGPLRVIYPTSGYQLDPTVYDPRRIWQLSSIDIR